MRYIGNELHYIIKNKRILFCMIGLLFVNIICFNMYLDSGRINSQLYKNYFDLITSNRIDVMELLAENGESVEANEIFEEYQLMLSHNDFLSKIRKEAEANKGIVLFQDDYSQRLIQKTEDDYEKLKNLNVELCGSYGLCSFLKYSGSYFFIIILGMILTIELIIRDKKNLLINLYKSTKNGDWRIILSKYAASMIALSVFWVIVYLINYYIVVYRYGTIGLGLPVQCLKDYFETGYHITIGYLLIAYYVAVLIFVLMLTAILFFAAISSSNEAVMLMKFVGVMLLSFFGTEIFNKIGFSLGYDFFFACVLKPDYFFQYRNYNIASYPIKASTVLICLCVAVTILFLTLTCIFFIKNEMYYKSMKIKGVLGNRKSKKTHSLLELETRKLLFGYKMIFILLFFAFIQLYAYTNRDVRWGVNDISYKYYMDQIEGPVTDDKIEFLNSEEQKYIALTRECEDLEQKIMDGEISEKYYNDQYKDLLKKMEKQDGFYKCLEYAKCVIESNNCKTEIDHSIGFVYDRGYNYLFGVQSNNQVLNSILLCLICFIIIPYIYIEDYKDNMNMLLETTTQINVLKRKKIVLAISIVIVVYIGIYLTELVWVINTFGIENINYSIQSLPALRGFPLDFSILEYLFLVNVLRIGVLGFALTAEIWMGKLMKNTYLCIITLFVVLGIPLVFLYMNISGFSGYIVNRILVGNLV